MPINFLWCPSKCMNGHNKYTVCLLYNQACFAKASLFTVHGKETNFSTHYSTIKLNYIPSNDVKMLWELHSLPSISHSSHSYKLYITILCCTYSVLHDIFISFVNRKMVEMEFVLSMNARTFSFLPLPLASSPYCCYIPFSALEFLTFLRLAMKITLNETLKYMPSVGCGFALDCFKGRDFIYISKWYHFRKEIQIKHVQNVHLC